MDATVKKKLKKSTIGYLLLGSAGSLAVQTSWINFHVMLLFHSHPRLSWIGTSAVFLLTILHTPQAIEVLESVQSGLDAPDATPNP